MEGTVFLLDYSKIEREKIKHVFGVLGHFNFTEAGSIEEYNALAETIGEVALVIIDIAFPHEEQGLHIIEELRKTLNPAIPVIIMTKSSDLKYRNAASKLGVYDYISKPYQISRLEKSLSSIFRKERKFYYDISGINNINLTFEEYITKELKLADRLKQPLSIIRISMNGLGEDGSYDTITLEDMNHASLVVTTNVRQALRATDTVTSNSNGDIIIVLQGTDSHGAEIVSNKIPGLVEKELQKRNINFSEIFVWVYVTYPQDGTDFQALMECSEKRMANKEILGKINSIPINTRKYAKRRYNQFNRWF